MSQQTVALDFDGVVHAYTTPWESHNIIPDAPVPGAKEAIEFLRELNTLATLAARRQAVLDEVMQNELLSGIYDRLITERGSRLNSWKADLNAAYARAFGALRASGALRAFGALRTFGARSDHNAHKDQPSTNYRPIRRRLAQQPPGQQRSANRFSQSGNSHISDGEIA